ncbi:cytochrome c (plasmid) [Acidiphilium multivorum AIU301]|uniref:Cytochrome c n=1 Tax=Acidiphilium multivorum (strain DSM 11245 / JCM 8867 / NBRC 100883 / AIU 301) TaxID=926570 RepID=F0J7W8_ACIMA|nr:c-type cytochrome [Acidiphilium multivorum]BAJ83185.1 cytochrome c [Acidiphilium multivorum AIU301]GAN75055.1 cytochrome c [Acidiphilium multivorum AIU301]
MVNRIALASFAAVFVAGFATAATPVFPTPALAGGMPDGNAVKGKTIFSAQCAACHSVVAGQNGIGPSLYGVFGKPAASVAGFPFSPALKSAHIVWTAAALDKFLTNPQAAVPGTKMPYMGMPNAQKRANVIAYLATLKDQN